LFGCASIGPPGGGPEDKEPPEIISVVPASGSTGVDPNSVIEIEFSEPVNRETLLEALFITPPQSKKPKVKVRGERVRIRLSEAIPEDRTLVVSIGTGVTDLRRNKLENSYAIALTAGESIDQGRISGWIFSAISVQGMLTGAWRVDDSLMFNPVEIPPEFLTQAGADGDFILDFLPTGRYRVACWDDKDNDRLYSPGEDRIGLPWRDVTLDKDGQTWIELYPSKRDTAVTRLFMVSAPNGQRIELRFNRAIEMPVSKTTEGLSIFDSTGVLKVQQSWLNAADSSKLVLITEEQKPGNEYFVSMYGDTTLYSFSGSEYPDTLGPRIVASYPEEHERNVSELPAGWIAFDDVLAPTDFDRFIGLSMIDIVSLDSMVRDTTLSDSMVSDTTISDSIEIPLIEIPLQCRLGENNILLWETEEELPFGTEFTLLLDLTGLSDLNGNPSPDSSWTIRFFTIDPVETGSITGSISAGGSFVIVTARSVKGRYAGEFSVSAGDDGTFTLERLRASEYLIWAFFDNDCNDSYNFGRVDPFGFSERFTVHPDTLTVRERWETGGVLIEFK